MGQHIVTSNRLGSKVSTFLWVVLWLKGPNVLSQHHDTLVRDRNCLQGVVFRVPCGIKARRKKWEMIQWWEWLEAKPLVGAVRRLDTIQIL